jgi:hypothetical protein
MRVVRGRSAARLLDTQGEPLVGATVKVVGKQKWPSPTSTVIMRLDDVDPNDVLEFSYIGMKTYRRKAGTKQLNIIMEDDSRTLGDVVVTGMQRMDKRLFTGSTTND